MKLRVVAVGNRMPQWVDTATNEYLRRLDTPVIASLHEVAASKRGKNPDINRIKSEEGERIVQAVPERHIMIALDERGKALATRALADQLQEWIDSSQDVCFVIGGPDGLSSQVKQGCDKMIRLSDFTLAHPLARVVLAEQLYRAYSIIRNLPYHRE